MLITNCFRRKYALAGLKHVLNTTPTDQKLTIMYDIVCACVGRFEVRLFIRHVVLATHHDLL